MRLFVGDSSLPDHSPAVSVHRRIASEQMVAKNCRSEEESLSQNCPFRLRASTLIVGALIFLRTYTLLSHTHVGWALIVELRGFTRCPFGSLDHSLPSISLRGSCALAFPAMRSLLPSGTTKRQFVGGEKRVCLL